MFGTKPKKFGCNVRNQNKTGHIHTTMNKYLLVIFWRFGFVQIVTLNLVLDQEILLKPVLNKKIG